MTIGIVAFSFVGVYVWHGRTFDDCSQCFVTDRPDLTHEGEAWWAKNHAADFIPIQKAQHLKIAITQDCLAPAPESLIAQFSLSDKDLKSYLHGKSLRSDSIDAIVTEEATHGLIHNGGIYSQLSWWPPEQTPTLKTYEAQDKHYGQRYFVFLDARTKLITVIAPASRGR